ncbi:hypothetical protein IE81DRAFT_200623 [Ceraceosorus guamensis]|uniref:Uncharacterized protein n=1 Tax=Ceraceosorus guamensis TaxID=1522189 RepID=A0A316VTQ8_9BASI|nr:hypothetical protein IE81DRAFT_200623 [Ceraceosorus guamensis]PWN40882.1 hypothetical protein IE81DRAFT_200623 [Ceraceosorus guamensis]
MKSCKNAGPIKRRLHVRRTRGPLGRSLACTTRLSYMAQSTLQSRNKSVTLALALALGPASCCIRSLVRQEHDLHVHVHVTRHFPPSPHAAFFLPPFARAYQNLVHHKLATLESLAEKGMGGRVTLISPVCAENTNSQQDDQRTKEGGASPVRLLALVGRSCVRT